jgi:hypothetical protein
MCTLRWFVSDHRQRRIFRVSKQDIAKKQSIDPVRSKGGVPTNSALRALKPREISLKVADGSRLYLLVLPSGAKYWRYN